MHYEGKSHDKRARQFLQSWALQSKQGIPVKKKDVEITESSAKSKLSLKSAYCSVKRPVQIICFIRTVFLKKGVETHLCVSSFLQRRGAQLKSYGGPKNVF